MLNEELVFLIQKGIDSAENMAMLYMQNRKLIYSIISKYRYACRSSKKGTPIIEMGELMNEAYFGLVKAVESFDFTQGIRFMSYAPYWIRLAVKRYLDNCGRIIRVPVHKQEKVFRYNQVTAYFLKSYNREATTEEYASWLRISKKSVEELEKFMFQDKIRSLDETVQGSDDESICLADSICTDSDMENEIVEKASGQELRNELWDTIYKVLKDDNMVRILRQRFIDDLTFEEIGSRNHMSGAAAAQLITQILRLLRRNTRIKNLGMELGVWDEDIINISMIKDFARNGHADLLRQEELSYARRMEWIKGDKA